MTLRLLADLYHAQNLREDGGIARNVIWWEYKREKVGQCAQYVIWGFAPESSWINWQNAVTPCHRREKLTQVEIDAGENPGVDFSRRQKQLTDLGLLQWVPHLFESEALAAEAIHPYGVDGTVNPEDRLGAAAHEAGLALLTPGQGNWASDKRLRLVPVPRHVANVQMIGIARLRYRPHTKLTTAWWAELNQKVERYIQEYEMITARPIQAPPDSMQHQGIIKGVSRVFQGDFNER
jgi:hypothetical protein